MKRTACTMILSLALALMSGCGSVITPQLFPDRAAPQTDGLSNPPTREMPKAPFICRTEHGIYRLWELPQQDNTVTRVTLRFLEPIYDDNITLLPAAKLVMQNDVGAQVGLAQSHFFFTTVVAGYQQSEEGDSSPLKPYGGFGLGDEVTMFLRREGTALSINVNDQEWSELPFLAGGITAFFFACQSSHVEVLSWEQVPLDVNQPAAIDS